MIANPPFNMSDWGGQLLSDDPRWMFDTPPSGNANFAWVQHMIYHLSSRGRAGFVLSNGSMSTNTRGEKEIRQKMIDADLVECMVALPPQLFYNTQIPACLWFLNKAKPAHRKGQTLFIDARRMGFLVDRTLRDLSDANIDQIAGTFHQRGSYMTDYTFTDGTRARLLLIDTRVPDPKTKQKQRKWLAFVLVKIDWSASQVMQKYRRHFG